MALSPANNTASEKWLVSAVPPMIDIERPPASYAIMQPPIMNRKQAFFLENSTYSPLSYQHSHRGMGSDEGRKPPPSS